MIDPRTRGIINAHFALISIEAMILWVCLSVSGLPYSTLLNHITYPAAIMIGVGFSRHYFGLRDLADIIGRGRLGAIRLTLRQLFCVCIAIFGVAVGLKDPGISRLFLLIYLSTLPPFLLIINFYQVRLLTWRFFQVGEPVPTLLIGSAERFPEFYSWLKKQRTLGHRIIGLVSYRGLYPSAKAPKLGDFSKIAEIISATDARKVVMLDQPDNPADAERLVEVCLAKGCRFYIHNNFGNRLRYPLTNQNDGHHHFMTLHDEPLEDPINQALKRILDVGMAVFVLLFLLPPLCLAVWLVQRRQSPGPVFYRQTRTGLNHKTFKILKFRTMHVRAPGDEARQAAAGDSRIYPFGKFLRCSSLDEIPQFLNVLKGEMSVSGPRPHLIDHDREFAEFLGHYRMRFLTKPGITGLAQIRGFRGETDTPEKVNGRVALDLEYIRTWSIWLDLWIILQTVKQVIRPPNNAY